MKICVLGLGKMGSTLVQGMIDNNIFAPEDIVGCDLKVEKKDNNSRFGGIKTVSDNTVGVELADTVLLAVKPGIIDQVISDINSVLDNKLVISIAAGVTISHLKEKLPSSCRVIRVMPNTPALVKAGMSAYAPGSAVTKSDRMLVKKILKGVGEVVKVKEELMDAVTGLSGSGPAYGYMMIEALADGGVLQGLPREEAVKLAAQTMLGAAKMVLETDKHPGELKDMVTSPGGTTINGVETLEQNGLRGILIEAVKKASERSQELG